MPDSSRFREEEHSPLDLQLDPYNPRLALEEEGASQETLLEIMDERFKIDDIAESIIAGATGRSIPSLAGSTTAQSLCSRETGE